MINSTKKILIKVRTGINDTFSTIASGINWAVKKKNKLK